MRKAPPIKASRISCAATSRSAISATRTAVWSISPWSSVFPSAARSIEPSRNGPEHRPANSAAASTADGGVLQNRSDDLSGFVIRAERQYHYSFHRNPQAMSTPTRISSSASPGSRLRAAVAQERPLQIVGAINAYTARLAAASGFKALYLSGGGVAANSLGVPDLGISSMDDVLTDIRRITDACALPLLVDADTGWGGGFNKH